MNTDTVATPQPPPPETVLDVKVVYFVVNGIRTWPGDSKGWTDRAVRYIHINHPYARAEKYEYHTWAISRRLKQQRRAVELAEFIREYLEAGYKVILVGHSNGCDLIGRALALLSDQHVQAVHLFAAAADAHTFLIAMENNWVYDITLYCGGRDGTLKYIARFSRWALGWAGYGYGSLGTLPEASRLKAKSPDHVTIFHEPSYGHSTWFKEDIFRQPFVKWMSNVIL